LGTFSKGDNVRWRVGRTEVSGTVERVLTRPAKVGKRTVKASAADPRYVVKAGKSGATTVRRGPSLTPVLTKRRWRPAKPALGRGWIAAALGLLVLLGAVAAYFLYLPGQLAGDYEDGASAAFIRVDDSMFQVYESLHSRYFRGLAITKVNDERAKQDPAALRKEARRQYASDHSDIDAARESIADASAAIAHGRSDLTSVDGMPLLSGIGDMGDANQTADRGTTYLDQASDYLNEYRELVDYSAETLRVDELVTNAFLDNLPGIGASLAEYKFATAQILKGLFGARGKYRGLGGSPTGAYPFRFEAERSLDLFIHYLQSLRAGVDQLDIGQIDAANRDLKVKVRTLSVRSLIQFDRLQTHSDLSHTVDELETREDALAHRLHTRPSSHSISPPALDLGPKPGTSKS
jgi:hypothetical protein